MTRIQIEFTDIIANQVRWERKNKAIPLMGRAIIQAQLVVQLLVLDKIFVSLKDMNWIALYLLWLIYLHGL